MTKEQVKANAPKEATHYRELSSRVYYLKKEGDDWSSFSWNH